MKEILYDCIIIGGGQSGLAAAYHLQKASLRFLVLEKNDMQLGSWAAYYDSLKLFSPARYSSLPELAFPGDPDRYPDRDDVVQYLKTYAEHFSIPIQYQVRVEHISKDGDIFSITSSAQEIWRSRSVICATGPFIKPYTPSIPGSESYKGALLHSIRYKNTEQYQGDKIVVVGAGNSAVQIATELAQVADVTIASRKPIQFTPQTLLGKDIHFWTDFLKLDQSRLGKWILKGTSSNVLDPGRYREALARQRPRQKKMFLQFTERGVVWDDGTAENIDTVIFATGFVPNYPFLRELNALDHSGSPIEKDGISRKVRGLYFVGLPFQFSLASATLRGAGKDASFVVKHLKKSLTQLTVEKQSCCRSGRRKPTLHS